ncbi:MAG: cyclopropane-fatty-acyl-phospholipid synthase family protein [Deltaproteobacteria bacterium]|jgi:cyclopropane-fatty-acyl-phospholipid synthase|nr:cyclopropane-fatty-acyl-phospholipid synthase family protein [Deltaproteobacteria bacterium]MDA8307062.1 cyclopropane-fatty-acyl-phospholipid synthase [Deltaproteobacteria bacterium]
MKKALRELAAAINRVDPSAAFAFKLWDGEVIGYGSSPKTTLTIKSPTVSEKLFGEGFMGFGEAYVAGDLEVGGDLQELLRLGLSVGFDGKASLREKIRLLPFYLKTTATVRQSRKNIAHHYDLTPEFYSLFLDESLTYSCGYFNSENDSLDLAQRQKYDLIARKLMLGPEDTTVDIGCGWGAMLLRTAREYCASGVGITLSNNQYDYVRRKIEELGLGKQIEVKLLDYRQLEGKFDKFVSIGMFEHVGKRFIPAFMRQAARLLKKGGTGLLHTIAKEVESPTDPWTRRYIFPGGYIPGLPETLREMGRAGLCVLDVEGLRPHYGRTLDCWISNFENNVGRIREMFGERFVRIWRLYLNSSSAGFKYGGTRVYQILFSKGLNNDLPATRGYMYVPNGL